MKGLRCNKPGSFEYIEMPLPVAAPGHALVRIKRVGICGTDYHGYRGTQPFFNYPRILGHELSGELVDAGDAEGFEKGEALTIIPYFNCRKCIACRNGKPNCCIDIKVCGVHIDGGMVEYLSVPTYALVKGEGLGYDELALVEPLAIGAHGIRQANVQPGEFVLVIGAGPIGLGTMDFARIAGAQVIALDINAERLQFCKDKLKIPFIINVLTDDVIAELKKITKDDMPTVVIDASGNQQAINNALKYLSHGGRFVLIGLQREEIKFSHPEFHKRESTLMSSRNATVQDFRLVIDSIKSGVIDPSVYITHRTAFEGLKNIFENWLDPSSGVIKAVVEMN